MNTGAGPWLAQAKLRLKAHLPTPDSLRGNRWLSWLGPSLYHPRLWHMSRRGLALGMAIGIFFGFLIPIAQIPFSAAAAVALRANLPVAMVSTLVTNPVTFAPVYYAAYKTGNVLLGQTGGDAVPIQSTDAIAQADGTPGALQRFWAFVTGVGQPLVLGLALFAVCGGLLVYALANWVWIAMARRRHRQRRQQRSLGSSQS